VEDAACVLACALARVPATEAHVRALLAWNLVERHSRVVFTLDTATELLSATLRTPLAMLDGAETAFASAALDDLPRCIADAGFAEHLPPADEAAR
jgi:hypothetical protein